MAKELREVIRRIDKAGYPIGANLLRAQVSSLLAENLISKTLPESNIVIQTRDDPKILLESISRLAPTLSGEVEIWRLMHEPDEINSEWTQFYRNLHPQDRSVVVGALNMASRYQLATLDELRSYNLGKNKMRNVGRVKSAILEAFQSKELTPTAS